MLVRLEVRQSLSHTRALLLALLTSHHVFQCESPGSGSLKAEPRRFGVRDTPVAPSVGSTLYGLLGG